MKTILKSLTLLGLILLIPPVETFCQIGINHNGNSAHPSAMLDVVSSDKGFLFPRLTTAERNSLPSPATGLMIYNASTNLFNYYNGTEWFQIETSLVSVSTGTIRPGGGVSLSSKSNTPPDSSAMLDVTDSTRGVLIPRTTPGSITSPATGLIIYNSSTNNFNYYDGSTWKGLCTTTTGSSGASGSQNAIGVSVNENSSPVDPSAILDISSTDKGILIPRLTENQRDALLPVVGLTIYNLTSNTIEFYNGTGWYKLMVNFISSPTPGTHIPSQTQIIWTWEKVPGAIGYKWDTINDYGTANDMGSDTSQIETGLTCNNTYMRYVWAYYYCGNSLGTSLTQITTACTWSCGQSFTDSRDGKSYNTVLIGTQCWMAQNLNMGTWINGSVTQTNNDTIEKYCYNDDTAVCTIYGGLYQWGELMNYTTSSNSNPSGRQGICPTSWHIPSDSEWMQLTTYLGGTSVAGGKMKETGTTHWSSPNTGATNTSGFTALPGGYRSWYGGTFSTLNGYGCFWSSTESSSTYALEWELFYGSESVSSSNDLHKTYGFSARCLLN